MSKIAYMFGAGASADAVPVVTEIPSRLIIYKNYLAEHFSNKGLEDYIITINDIILNISNRTIDGYARNLYQNKTYDVKSELSKLKAVIIGFFLFEQMRKKHTNFKTDDLNYDSLPAFKKSPDIDIVRKISSTVDGRYLSFIGKVLNENNQLNEKINIISWNYDMQFELAMEQIGIQYTHLNKHCSIFPYPSSTIYPSTTSLPNIIKLNGTAGIFKKEKGFATVYESNRETFDDIIDMVLGMYKEACGRYTQYEPFFRFAWEHDSHSDEIFMLAKGILESSTVLVIIGYSFPDFNRSIDRRIFSGSTGLEAIYLQVREQDRQKVTTNIKALGNDIYQKINFIDYTSDFFLPPEF